ncbi:MAG: histidinol phosphatase [Paludisphaera borealis]|uniref:histidinol phosphatase n=1 Tax=Paludisphaera borealis TaxID=1387353 RepID=UPI00283C531C|nr:histidinol phosphatase [Paludisphaera borealis]MDR3621786.1 histidinol phosphatase [Paludisphaera borealis]
MGITMFMPRRGVALTFAARAVLAVVLTTTGRGASAEEPKKPDAAPKVTSRERLSRRRLAAAHEAVARIAKGRRTLDPPAGFHDYRAILHAHAEDSAHTGGTRPEILAEAKRAGVDAVLLSDHYRPPRDFVNDSWRGLREGVLFVPGSEVRGFLAYPMKSVMDRMEAPLPDFVSAVTSDGGLIFLSHIEERPDHSMEGLTGLEIYNRHYDAKRDAAGMLALILKVTAPDSLRELEEDLTRYPEELFAFHVEYPAEYLAKWDRETKERRLTGVAANDCHHNQVLIVKMIDEGSVRVGTNVDKDEDMRKFSALLRPGIRAMTKGRKPGDVLARVDLDPYHRSFQNVSTHVFAPELTEPAVREALREGRAYVSHDWMCDPRGFRFGLVEPAVLMGGEVAFKPGLKLSASFPVACRIRLIQDGREVVSRSGDSLEYDVTAPGVYRVEGWLDLGSEERGWIYANPVYVRGSRHQ